MGRTSKAVLAIAVVLCVSAVLITPDLSDDVDGVLHHQLQILHFGLTNETQVYDSSARVSSWAGNNDSSDFHFVELVDLLCARLC